MRIDFRIPVWKHRIQEGIFSLNSKRKSTWMEVVLKASKCISKEVLVYKVNKKLNIQAKSRNGVKKHVTTN